MNRAHSTNRGDQTREALLEAAAHVFGRDGFHAASTRAIATAAGVNQALIGYHFGGKEGLYLAVYQSMVEQLSAAVSPVVQRISETLDSLDPADPGTRQSALASLEAVMSALAMQFSKESTAAWARLVVREQHDPTAAFELLYEGFYQPLMGVITRLLGLLLQRDPTSKQVHARAVMVVGQMVVFMAARTMAMRHMDWSQLGPEEMELVREQLVDSLRAQFGEAPSP